MLIVDDNPDMLERVAGVLSPACEIVGTVENGAAALDDCVVARATRPATHKIGTAIRALDGDTSLLASRARGTSARSRDTPAAPSQMIRSGATSCQSINIYRNPGIRERGRAGDLPEIGVFRPADADRAPPRRGSVEPGSPRRVAAGQASAAFAA